MFVLSKKKSLTKKLELKKITDFTGLGEGCAFREKWKT